MIELSSREVFTSDDFKRISQEGLMSLLKFEQLNISEYELLQACFGWVDDELRRQRQELSQANRIMLFGEIKNLIRFGDLKFEDVGTLEIESYLTIDEIGSMLLHLSNRLKPLAIEYRSPRELFRKFKYSVQASEDGVMSGNFNTREVSFRLRVNKRVFVENIEMQSLSISDAIFCEILMDGSKTELNSKHVAIKNDTNWLICFEHQRLELQPNLDYQLAIKFTVPYQGKNVNFYYSQLSFSKQLMLKNEQVGATFEIDAGFGYHCIKTINFYETN